MRLNAVENILPRDQDDVKQILNEFSEIIEQAINFGTHLLKWDLDSNLSGDEEIIPVLFLRNILEIADSISILLKKSSVDTSKVLLRSLLENVFGLEYLIEKDSKNRAFAFIVWMTHKDLSFYDKLNRKTHAGKQFKSNFSKDKYIQNPGIISRIDYKSSKENSEEILKLPQYIEIEKEYQQRLLKDKKPTWYSFFDGPKNIEQLAKYLKHDAIYEIMYRGYSGNVHATDIFKNKLWNNSNGTVDIIQIRSPKDAQSVAISTINFLLMIYIPYFSSRIKSHQHKEKFRDWYLSFKPYFDELRKPENEITLKT